MNAEGGDVLLLDALLKGIEYTVMDGNIRVDITGIAYDSRQVQPGFLFVCINGFKTDGHLYIKQAVEKGAKAVLVERTVHPLPNLTIIKTNNTRQALSVVASNYYDKPSSNLRVIGITGTNGKTTTTHLIKAILEEAGSITSIMGTLYARVGSKTMDFAHTTPEALEIERFLRISLDNCARYAVMEVSSHALDLYRVHAIDFNVAAITNITQDHLDYHKNMENYKKSKQKLFAMLPKKEGNFAVVNVDDSNVLDFYRVAHTPVITYGINNECNVRAVGIKTTLKGSNFSVYYNNDKVNIQMKLIGLFNVYNTLAAIAVGLGEGIKLDVIIRALEKVEGVPGRFEKVDLGQDFTVVIDYAHTPDGLENTLRTGRQIAENRLLTVFGCGGDRDRGKRPLMGEVAARYSDFCVVTSDNPRSEDPLAIINDIKPGLDKVENSRYAIITDRKEAIRHALYLARKGDLVIIAGKGHESYQLVKDKVLDFDDKLVATELLKGLI
ncbi:MAG: UDP-N-acetylmuramoyl-L-alanyl-D-glutamate--2,6-diaminopimelate ligase [Syntrophomonadaceae bacterium]|jgi:UDP-N-acetylmuramoyl-L-alanyl-D-glutamate--2,6-diaminopimelate ligase